MLWLWLLLLPLLLLLWQLVTQVAAGWLRLRWMLLSLCQLSAAASVWLLPALLLLLLLTFLHCC
jgi:hypothetical protein